MPQAGQNDARRSTRAHIAGVLAIGLMLITGCGEGGADEPGPGANEPAASSPTSASSDTATSSPEPEPEASVEPATGAVMKVEAVKSSSQLRLPKGYRQVSSLPMSATGYEKSAALTRINLYTFVNTAYPADTDELAKLWRGRGQTPFGPQPRRLDDVVVDGTTALHLVGRGEERGLFAEVFQVISADYEERVMLTFTFGSGESEAERQQFIEPVLATWTFSW